MEEDDKDSVGAVSASASAAVETGVMAGDEVGESGSTTSDSCLLTFSARRILADRRRDVMGNVVELDIDVAVVRCEMDETCR